MARVHLALKGKQSQLGRTVTAWGGGILIANTLVAFEVPVFARAVVAVVLTFLGLALMEAHLPSPPTTHSKR